MSDTKVVIDNLGFPEDPRWHEGALWFSDMDQKAVLRRELSGQVVTVLHVDAIPSGLGWLPNGNLLIVSMSDRRLLQLGPAGVSEVADLSGLASFRCNDMVVDDIGRAYIGTFGFDFEAMHPFSPGEIILVPPRGPPRVVADGLAFPNGMAITPDKKTLIVSETLGERLTAFEIAADGTLGKRRVWAHLAGMTPDGISLDSEGAAWVASPVSSAVFRIQEGGRIIGKVAVSNQAYACRLGGPGLQTLYIATSYPLPSLFTLRGLPAPPTQTGHALTGRIEAVDVEIPGAGFP
jgi:sugar lactone lactonase YvrE